MKKRIILMLVLAVVVLSMIGLVACTDPNALEGTMTLVLLNGENAQEFSVDLSNFTTESKGLIAVLDLLQSQEKLTYEAQDSTYGKFLTRVNDLQPDQNAGEWLCLYTTVEKDKSVDAYTTTLEHNGVTLTSSGVGSESMTLEDGCTILIKLMR